MSIAYKIGIRNLNHVLQCRNDTLLSKTLFFSEQLHIMSLQFSSTLNSFHKNLPEWFPLGVKTHFPYIGLCPHFYQSQMAEKKVLKFSLHFVSHNLIFEIVKQSQKKNFVYVFFEESKEVSTSCYNSHNWKTPHCCPLER